MEQVHEFHDNQDTIHQMLDNPTVLNENLDIIQVNQDRNLENFDYQVNISHYMDRKIDFHDHLVSIVNLQLLIID